MDSKSKNVASAFYELPARKTSVDIIREARDCIKKETRVAEPPLLATSVKPLQTQRPFTPREKERILFGSKGVRNNRPPSTFSLRYLQTEAEVTPISTESSIKTFDKPKQQSLFRKHFFKSNRSNSLVDLENNEIFSVDLQIAKPKLPALEALKPLQKRKCIKNTYSLDNCKFYNLNRSRSNHNLLVPEELEDNGTEIFQIESRNAFSSPQERTEYSSNSPFGRPSKQQSLSQCLLLGPQNLNKLFGNKQIVENSETLFVQTGYFNKSLRENRTDLNTRPKNAEDVIEMLNFESKITDNEDVIVNLLNQLYECMEEENLLSSKINSKMKIQVLKCLYKFVDSDNEKLLLNIARIILALKVTGNNLSGVCKLIFKVSKNAKNDHLFFEKNVLELFVDALGRSSPLDDGEACVYGYGSVKFLTMNAELLKRILSLGILQLMVLHIKIVNNSKLEKTPIPEQTNHALFQLTGALRNLAIDDEIFKDFITTGTVSQLCDTIDLFSSNLDIVSNISRTLSTLSTNENCCSTIAEHKNIFKTFIKLFDKYPGNEEIIVRLAYTVGNILSKYDESRLEYFNEKNSIRTVIHLWRIYLERTLKNCSLKLDNEDHLGSNTEDVMIKLIRIVANLAINTEIGKLMNEKFGAQLVDEFLKVLISNPFKKNEELVLSVLSTLNNLSYYYSADLDVDVFHIKQIDIVEAINEYISSQNTECVIETIRILGNLSRSKITRKYISEKQIFKCLVDILDNDDLNLLKTTCGVFVNLMADSKSRKLLKSNEGLPKLISILNLYGQDWTLSMLVCQVVWNYCIDSVDLFETIPDKEMQELMDVLPDLLDEERLFGVTESAEDSNVYLSEEYLSWEEFANVATSLLEKIENFIDTLEQLGGEEGKTKDSSTNISFSSW